MLPTRLKMLRNNMHLSQEELGKMVGVSKVSVCNWEKGIKAPSTDNLITISKVLNASLDYLIGSDYYVADIDRETYGIRMSKEEIAIIEELKKHKKVYDALVNDPKRTIDLIDRKIF